MKSYIIYISEYDLSVEMAETAYNSGVSHGWNIHYFEGVNGKTQTLEDFDLKIDPTMKKTRKAMQKPGVQGCFLSHFQLWSVCVENDTPLCVLEHDIEITGPFPEIEFEDVLKIYVGEPTKKISLGNWWNSAAAYCIKPAGAKKLVNFVQENGAMPADIMLNTGIVDITLQHQNVIRLQQSKKSFTKNL